MIRKYVLPVMAMMGFFFAVYVVALGTRQVPAAQAVAQPAVSPFPFYVAGAGIIEASSENIAIGTQTSGIVTKVFVKPGDKVKTGDPLFILDDRAQQAELKVSTASLEQAKARLDRLLKLPRPEDIPPAVAKVEAAQAEYADAKSQLDLYQGVEDKRAVSQNELDRRKFAVQLAQAKLQDAKAQLDLLKAGSWKPEIEIAQAQLTSAEAEVHAIQTQIDRLTTRAPFDGNILQVKTRAGEFAPAGVLATPLVLMGNLDKWHVRVDVDENDAWRIREEAAATACVRGNRDLQTSLKFVRIEPYVVPKRSLTGESVERVDTRVLQIIYSFEGGKIPVYVGQLMDVFIDAPPLGNATSTSANRTIGEP